MGFLLSSVLHADRIVTSFHTKFTIHWPLESPSSVNRTILPARSHYLQNPGRPVLCHFPFYLTKSVRSPFASNPARPCFGSRDAANSGSRESPSPHFGTERERERERERGGGSERDDDGRHAQSFVDTRVHFGQSRHVGCARSFGCNSCAIWMRILEDAVRLNDRDQRPIVVHSRERTARETSVSVPSDSAIIVRVRA